VPGTDRNRTKGKEWNKTKRNETNTLTHISNAHRFLYFLFGACASKFTWRRCRCFPSAAAFSSAHTHNMHFHLASTTKKRENGRTCERVGESVCDKAAGIKREGKSEKKLTIARKLLTVSERERERERCLYSGRINHFETALKANRL